MVNKNTSVPDILMIPGSSSPSSSNAQLLRGIANHFVDYTFSMSSDITKLPLFVVSHDQAPWFPAVLEWRARVSECSAVIISTPAYLHNIPAVLKNALEWLTTSGELDGKPVLALTYTPYPPRGEEAMQSLLWSLGALNARIVAQCPLYQNELTIIEDGKLEGDETIELIAEALKLL